MSDCFLDFILFFINLKNVSLITCKMRKRFISIAFIIAFVSIGYSLEPETKGISVEFKDEYYRSAFIEIVSMLDGTDSLNFKRALFITENAYLSNSMDYGEFCSKIDSITSKLNKFIKYKGIETYSTAPHYAVYSFMVEPGFLNDSCIYKYDFNDFMGNENWTNMFVTKLLNTKKGNCHSLPMMFKLLTEEMGVESYIAMAPSHLYIKHRDESGKWVNIELTNGGGFSSDSWIISSMGITTEAIKNDVYMYPLNLKQTVALCLYDLAMGYKEKYGHSQAVEMMCNKILEYYPNYIQAIMLKSDCVTAETISLQKTAVKNEYYISKFDSLETEFQTMKSKIESLGHREMTPEEYEKWSRSVEVEMKKQETTNK
jgi:hypothetical protein